MRRFGGQYTQRMQAATVVIAMLKQQWSLTISDLRDGSIVFFLAVGVLWCVLLAMNASAIALGHTSTSVFYSFASYDDIIPGESRDALKDRATLCLWKFEPLTRSEFCRFAPTDTIFENVDAHIYQNEIDMLDFTLRKDAIRIGDLIMLWGKPTAVYQYRQMLHFVWRKGIEARTPYSSFPSPLLPVLNIVKRNPAAPLKNEKPE